MVFYNISLKEKFKIISYRYENLPSRFSDTAVIGTTNNSVTDAIITSIFHEGVIPDFFPSEIQIDLTRRCATKLFVNRYLQGKTGRKPPRDCLNCSFLQEDLEYELSLSILRSTIQRFSHNGGRRVFFTGGGEPGEYPALMEAMRLVSDEDLDFGLNTNGSVILRLSRLQDEELQDIYKVSKKRTQYMSWSVHDLEDLNMFREMQKLSARFARLGLDVHFRTSYLVHPETTEEECKDFLIKSRAFGAAISTFKPAYYFDTASERRRFFKHQRIYDALKNMQVIFTDKTFTPNTIRIDRLRSDYKAIDTPICFSPLEKIIVNVFGHKAMCCDRKDEAQGQHEALTSLKRFPFDPKSYFLATLLGMLRFRDWPNCVQGCNQCEFNYKTYKYVESSRIFNEYLRLADIPENEREGALRRSFL